MTLGTWTSNSEIALLGKLREACAGSDFNLAVSLAEAPKACEMIADTARRVAAALVYTRKGQFAKAHHALTKGKNRDWFPFDYFRGRKSSVDTLSENWLALQYGWLPLMNDAENAAKFLAHHFEVPLSRVIRVKHIQSPSNAAIFSTSGYLLPSGAESYEIKRIKAVLREKNNAKLLGLLDPLSVAWELTPYSFVIDWFVPIGNFLSARALASSIEGTFVSSLMRTCSVGGMVKNPAGSGDVKIAPSNYMRQLVGLDRTVSTTLSVPSPMGNPVSKIVGWRHAANAVALLVGPTRKLLG